MRTVELIEHKRDGDRLAADEIAWLIDRYTKGEVEDYQMAALLMAVFFRGLDEQELADWTEAMLRSGQVLDLGHISAPRVDKHSTGGVGDKVSIPLAPMVAACGVVVPMMSGRGLGHTGGTLDKLQSIPGFTPDLDPPRFTKLLEELGLVLAGQSSSLVPADRKIYALRDATATVPSIPLIASSIMSKKLAEDLDGLVLDVKVGRGAFMGDESSARRLATAMVEIGRHHGTTVVAVLTAMDQPLGREVGNANELAESLEALRGGGPQDLLEVVYRLGEEMLLLAGVVADRREARSRLEEGVRSGRALDKLARVVEAQGGERRVLEDPGLLPQPPQREEFAAPRAGFVTSCDALLVGTAAMRLGAGRERKQDDVDRRVGISVLAKQGSRVERGEPLALVGWADRRRRDEAWELLERAWRIEDRPPEKQAIIIGEVRA
ncbi:MAG: thymidine phosphorylase [Actinomycetota bacterium]|nr:thymidine phosphorylase [Actinomycetota bacterium]